MAAAEVGSLVWVVVMETEVGPETYELCGVYGSEKRARKAVKSLSSGHEVGEPGTWCRCCDPAVCWRVVEMEVE